jgi:FtsP/CotA-like multicopper oxidase with cupredoxin domain
MQHTSDHTQTENRGNFPTDIRDLPESQPSEVVVLADGEEFDLGIAPMVKRLGDARVRMLAYNGSVPGPTMRVQQGSEVVINVTNEADTQATVHCHGLRLENAYDGTHETQSPMQVGESFSYRLQFHDPGCTGTTRTSARTTARRWAFTATLWSSRRTRTTGPR